MMSNFKAFANKVYTVSAQQLSEFSTNHPLYSIQTLICENFTTDLRGKNSSHKKTSAKSKWLIFCLSLKVNWGTEFFI